MYFYLMSYVAIVPSFIRILLLLYCVLLLISVHWFKYNYVTAITFSLKFNYLPVLLICCYNTLLLTVYYAVTHKVSLLCIIIKCRKLPPLKLPAIMYYSNICEYNKMILRTSTTFCCTCCVIIMEDCAHVHC